MTDPDSPWITAGDDSALTVGCSCLLLLAGCIVLLAAAIAFVVWYVW